MGVLPGSRGCVALLIAGLCSGQVYAHPGTRARLARIEAQIVEAPDDPAPRLRRAEAMRQAGHLTEALTDYQRAEDRGGNAGHIALGRGQTLLAAERAEEALLELDRAMAFLGAGPVVLRARAQTYSALGRPGLAADDLLRAFVDREQQSPEAVIELSRALSSAGRVDRALGVLDAAIARLGPRTSLARETLVVAYAHGRDKAVAARLAAWIADDPSPIRIAVLHAEALEMAGRLQAAHKAYQTARAAIIGTTTTSRRTARLHSRLGARVERGLGRLAGDLRGGQE